MQTEVEELAGLLRRFSPEVEISHEEPGVFWVNAAGLSDLFSSLDHWAAEIHAALTARERRASVVVGFRRFAVYAVARGREGILVLAAPDEEEAALRRVSLSVLAIDPRLRDTLAKLAIHTLGEFLRLPAAGIRRRFGDEASRLHALASGDIHDPFSRSSPWSRQPARSLRRSRKGTACASFIWSGSASTRSSPYLQHGERH